MTEDQRAELAAGDVPAEELVDEIDVEFDADATVVRPMRVDGEAEVDDDATVVRSRFADAEADSDATIVRPKRASASASADTGANADADAAVTGAQSRPVPAVSGPDHRGDPVPDPDHAADAAAQAVAAQATAAQGAASHDAAAATSRSGVLRRAANLMPRVYGPRPIATNVSPDPVTTAAGGVAASNPRAQLPSLARRDRRARLITLVGYAASVCVAGVGLWFVAMLAFAG